MNLPRTAAGPVRNPFCLPGLEANPHHALRWPEHKRFHVDVDRLEGVAAEFESVARSDSLVSQGRLVVVAGSKGSGKTSLIAKCVAALQKGQAEADTEVVVVDLTAIGPEAVVADRAQRAAQRLIDTLEVKGHLGTDRMALLKGVGTNPDRLYPQLSLILENMPERKKPLLAAVLPAWDDRVAKELEVYARLVGPRLVFFAESSHPDLVKDWTSRLSDNALAWPLLLATGPLKKTDCDRFAANRLGEDDVATAPRIEQVTMEWLDGQFHALTLERLQKLLHGVYESVLQLPQPPLQVTKEHFEEYLINQFGRGNS